MGRIGTAHLGALGLALVVATTSGAIDLAKRYPATIDFVEGAGGRAWSATEGDVYELSGFELEHHFDADLKLELGKSQLVIGEHEGNAVWAAVLPEKPGRLRTSLAGDGDAVTSVWLRFNPALVGELFPKQTVKGEGDPRALTWARRLCAWKRRDCWQSGGLPVVPWKSSLFVDCETQGGARRMYSVETEQHFVRYESAFASRGLPAPVPCERREALAAFDLVLAAFDHDYAGFGLLPALDWEAEGKRARKRAEKAETTYELADVLAQLVAKLEDLHAWVRVGDEWTIGYARERPLNASWQAVERALGGLEDTQRELVWGRTDDGVGYLNVTALANKSLPAAFDAALEQLADTWGLIVDLRFNGGGDELLARDLAGRFLEQPSVYSKNRYRSGPKHDQLGPVLARTCEPRGPWRYAAPVVVLQGRRTMSSAESFALMLAQGAQVTTMGDATAGSSGNPRALEPGLGIVVNLPLWLDLDPDGRPIERVGVAPDVSIAAEASDFGPEHDPVFEAALARLRAIPPAERRAGRVE